MDDCRYNDDEPLMYSQFCYHIQQDEQKRLATMHINHNPGEQVKVDWVGDPATIIDSNTAVYICRSISGYQRFFGMNNSSLLQG